MTEQKLKGDPSLPSTTIALNSLINEYQREQKYEVEDFFRNPEKTAYQLSPNGEYFSYLAPFERRQNIFIQKIGAEESIRITNETDRDIGGYFWANDDRLVYIKDDGGNENFLLFAVDKDGQNPKDLTPFENVRIDIIDPLKEQKDYLIIGMNKNNPQLFEPYRIHIKTGEVEQLAENTNPMEPISAWMTDHEGKLRVAFKVVGGTNSTIMYRDNEADELREVFTSDFRVSLQPLFFEFDNGSHVYATSNLNRDKAVIIKFDMAEGKEIGEPLFEHADVDVSQLSFSRKRKVLTSISYYTDKRHFHFLDDQRAGIQQRLEEELGDYEVVVTSVSDNEDKYMVRTFSDRSLGAYYFYNRTTDELKKIAEVSPWIDENDMAHIKPVSYTTRDGLHINGYLTLPNNTPPNNLPVIINPHGGPWVRDYWGFNPEIQLLASQGYAVLQMNYRGSTGYGRKFWECSFKQWGKTMQDDITDGVNWLVEQGIADPKRVAIYGGSYGGYATLAGVTFTPDLYACAVDYVGVSNLFTFLNTIPPYWEPYLDMMYEMVGHPERDKEHMATASPVLHVDKIKAPLFVVQGANDPRVNIDEADQIVRNLRERGVDVLYMVKYNEGHGFRNEENRFEFYKAMSAFLAKYLKSTDD